MMEVKEKKKLCWNCEGNVSLYEENCPYCGVYVGPSDEASDEEFSSSSQPPPSPYKPQPVEDEDYIPPSPYAQKKTAIQDEELQEEEQYEEEVFEEESGSDMKSVIFSIGGLLFGSVFFLFGLVLLLFSKDGYFHLAWNAGYWSIYLVISAPLLFLGWWYLQRVQDSSQHQE